MDTYCSYHGGGLTISGMDVESLQDALQVSNTHLPIHGIVVKESYASAVLTRCVLEQRLQ